MGIKGLNKFLKDACCPNGSSSSTPSYINKVPLKDYANKRIAVDAAIYLCMFKMRGGGQASYIESIINFIVQLMENLIQPLFVFDGSAPDEKQRERQLRCAKQDQQRERVVRLERDLTVYKSTGEISDELKEINRTRLKKRCTLVPDRFDSIGVENYVKDARTNLFDVTEEDFNTFKSILSLFRIPYITAESEGEFLCASLARNGLVDAVMTRDTDVLACLAPRMLTTIEGDCFLEISLDAIMSGLNFTSAKTWTDFCIMCGTDFNENIPKIGPHRAYNLLKPNKSIEDLTDGGSGSVGGSNDISILNHERTRELFAYDGVIEEMPPYIDASEFDTVKFEQWLVNTSRVNGIQIRVSIDTIKHRLMRQKKPKSDERTNERTNK